MKLLAEQGLYAECLGRPKSIHSIWNKMKKKNIPFEEVYDLFAIRIILDSSPENEKADCWKAILLLPICTAQILTDCATGFLRQKEMATNHCILP